MDGPRSCHRREGSTDPEPPATGVGCDLFAPESGTRPGVTEVAAGARASLIIRMGDVVKRVNLGKHGQRRRVR